MVSIPLYTGQYMKLHPPGESRGKGFRSVSIPLYTGQYMKWILRFSHRCAYLPGFNPLVYGAIYEIVLHSIEPTPISKRFNPLVYGAIYEIWQGLRSCLQRTYSFNPLVYGAIYEIRGYSRRFRSSGGTRFNPLVYGAIYEILCLGERRGRRPRQVSIPLYTGQYMKYKHLKPTGPPTASFNPLVYGAIYEIARTASRDGG